MNMILNYNFGEDSFEFEVSSDEQKECVSNLPKECLVDILSEYQEEMDPEELVEIKEELAEGKDTSLRLWAFEMFNELDEFREIAEEYFEDAAREIYEDDKAYNSDPLGYYGMSMRDFI